MRVRGSAHSVECNPRKTRIAGCEMRRGDLDKLRRLDPKLARQLEGVLARREAESKVAQAPEGRCEAGAAVGGQDTQIQSGTRLGEPEAACVGPLPCSATEASTKAPEKPVAASLESRFDGAPVSPGSAGVACEVPSAPASSPFTDVYAQAGLPEVPQVLVSTEISREEQLAEVWAGYEDEAVPPEELERRKAERKAELEAQRARDRAHARQLGFFPGAHFRRHGTGDHVSCEQLELQLDGIERRVGRASTWDEGLAAARTMEDVESQCFTVRDLGDRPDTMPGCLRGVFTDLTPSQWTLLRAVVTAYVGGAMGVYEYQPVLASDLGMSERALRYALNGGKDRPPGLVELGLVKRRQTWKRGSTERPSDHHYLLLQAGPALVDILLPMTCDRRAQQGQRVPRRSGYTRSSARREAARARQSARRARFDLAERAVQRVQGQAIPCRPEAPRERRKPPSLPPKIPPLNCPAQNADNPVPPPSGEGGLRVGRGKPPSPPSDESLRDSPLAPATPSHLPTTISDSPPLHEQLLRDRTRALDGAATSAPDRGRLELWRRRRARGVPVPVEIEEQLFSDLISAARSAMFGPSPVSESDSS